MKKKLINLLYQLTENPLAAYMFGIAAMIFIFYTAYLHDRFN